MSLTFKTGTRGAEMMGRWLQVALDHLSSFPLALF